MFVALLTDGLDFALGRSVEPVAVTDQGRASEEALAGVPFDPASGSRIEQSVW